MCVEFVEGAGMIGQLEFAESSIEYANERIRHHKEMLSFLKSGAMDYMGGVAGKIKFQQDMIDYYEEQLPYYETLLMQAA